MTRRKSRTEERREAWGLVPSYEEIETGEKAPKKPRWGKRAILDEDSETEEEEDEEETTQKESFFDQERRGR